jgi:hypothetical protein
MAIRDDLVAAHEPWLTPELTAYLQTIGDMFAEVESFDGTGEDDAWQVIVDPDRARVQDLPYVAQFVGERIPTGLDEPAAREWVKDAPHRRRGTVDSVWQAAQRKLTGSRTVTIIERDGISGGDDPDRITVITYTDETPDPDGVLADLASVLPWDIEINHEVVDGQTWNELAATYPTWNDVAAHYTTWAQVFSDRSSGLVFSRARP